MKGCAIEWDSLSDEAKQVAASTSTTAAWHAVRLVVLCDSGSGCGGVNLRCFISANKAWSALSLTNCVPVSCQPYYEMSLAEKAQYNVNTQDYKRAMQSFVAAGGICNLDMRHNGPVVPVHGVIPLG